MRFLTPIMVVLLLASLILNVVVFAKYTSRRPILTVNGVSITKKDMQDYLEQNFSPQYKAMQVQRILIGQEAKKQNCEAKDTEVLERYNEQKETDWQFAKKIRENPWIADESKNEIRMGIEAGRLLVKNTSVSPEEVTEEYTRSPALYDTPNKARTELAILTNETHLNEIMQLMQKGKWTPEGQPDKTDPPVEPVTIMKNYPQEVNFLGDNFHFTVTQHFGTPENQVVFSMKPGEVKRIPLDPALARMGVKAMLVRLIKIEPGHKNDPMKDLKTKEKIEIVLASRRGSIQSILQKLWDNANIVSEEPLDKKNIEMSLFPDRFK